MQKEMGALLAEAREHAGMTQLEIAKRLKIHQSQISRMETGESGAGLEEYAAYLELIPTDEGKRLRRVIGVEWKHLPRPPLRHPDLDKLIEVEEALERLKTFTSGNIPRVLIGQADMLLHRLSEFGLFLLDLRHSLALVGDIHVGKTTAACRQAGLVLAPGSAPDLKGVMLDTGGGRVTMCDVYVSSGNRFAIEVDPLPDEEIYRLAAEFSRSLLANREAGIASDFNVSEEIERALRNMSGLVRTRRKVGEKMASIDPAAELAKSAGTPAQLGSEIASRLTLWRRTKRKIDFEGADENVGRQWLKNTFSAINNGRHPDFSMPARITVTVPFLLFPGTPFEIDLIDTRGVDGSAIRSDIVAQLKDRRTVTLLCSRFGTAPDVSIQSLLQHITETEVDPALDSRLGVLVLARAGEALGMRDDTGKSAHDVSDGYAIKQGQVENALAKIGFGRTDVQFFDSASDETNDLREWVVRKAASLRRAQAEGITSAVTAVDQMLRNVQRAQAMATLEKINKDLTIFADRHKSLTGKPRASYGRLIAALRERHPRTVWAATRRNGVFWNFNVYQYLGAGGAAEAKRRSEPALLGLREMVKNKLADESVSTSHTFLEQLLGSIDAWESDFVEAVRHHSVEVYRPDLSTAGQLWNDCESKYGLGLPYCAEIGAAVQKWFENHEDLEDKLELLIQRAWQVSFLQPLQKATGDILAEETAGA